MMDNRTSYSDLYAFSTAVFLAMGHTKDHAQQAANALLQADIRGIDSHGVARLSGYLRLWKEGRINSTPVVRIIHQTPSTAVVDGDSGLGLIVGQKAMRIAIEKAETSGTGWVAVKNSTHFGIAAYHAMVALQKNMIGLAMTNASPLVAPTFSTERLLGTNPICIAIPAGEEPPFIADFSTTTAANGKLEVCQRKGDTIPLGWVQKKDGSPSTNSYELQEAGALLPLGSDSEHGSHKGFCLGAWVDIFSGVLSGANYGPWVPPFVSFLSPSENPVGKGIGHFFGVLRTDAFRPVDEFNQHMDTWIKRFRNASVVPSSKKLIIPGDIERETAEVRQSEGIPLHASVVDNLNKIARDLHLPPLSLM